MDELVIEEEGASSALKLRLAISRLHQMDESNWKALDHVEAMPSLPDWSPAS